MLLHTWKPVCLSTLLLLAVDLSQSGFIQQTTVRAVPLLKLESKIVVPVELKDNSDSPTTVDEDDSSFDTVSDPTPMATTSIEATTDIAETVAVVDSTNQDGLIETVEEKLYLSGPFALPTPRPKLDRQDDIITTATEATSKAASSTTVSSTAASSTTTKGPKNENGFIDWSPYSQIFIDDENQEKKMPARVRLLNIRPDYMLPKISPTAGENHNADEEERDEELERSDEFESFDELERSDEEENEEKVHKRRKRGTSTYNPDLAACGGKFRNLYGTIQSPQFPLYYPRNKECLYDIEVPSENYTVKVTCDVFTLQGGTNCTYDYLSVSPSGNSSYPDEERYCGAEAPVITSTTNRLLIKFVTDDLFRYQGFSCRYRAIQPNGIAVPGSFGNTSENTKTKTSGNSFLQVVQCPQVGPTASTGSGDSTSEEENTEMGTSMYSGLWNGMCGNQNDAPTGRIVGGWGAMEHQFPWMAAVLRVCGNEYCHICGATIISEEWIMTGAHCMANVAKEELGVLVGDHDLFSVSNDQKFIGVKEKVVHPDYNVPTPLNNDIGLLRLSNPIVFTKYISPLCLPALGETGFEGSLVVNASMLDTTGLSIVGQNATVLGWGMINDEKVYAEGLRGVQVEILENSVCNRLYGIMTENMMCTSGNNGRGTCYGDSGGPAVVQAPDGTWVQVGILAFGALAGCELGYPSGQVLVHKYIDWIQAITGIAFGAQFG